MKLIHNPGSSADIYHTESCNTKSAKLNRASYEMNYERSAAPLGSEKAEEVIEGAPRDVRIKLDVTAVSADMPVETAITNRRSQKDFSRDALPMPHLAKVLYLANGARPSSPDASSNAGASSSYGSGSNFNFPSAGGLASTQIDVFVLNVAGVEPGIYRFDRRTHDLVLKKKGNFSTWLKEFGILQIEFGDAGAVLILSCDMARLAEKYSIRAYRLGLMDAGHVSENIYLAAHALDLCVCATAGFIDSEINSALGFDGLDQCALLALGIGLANEA